MNVELVASQEVFGRHADGRALQPQRAGQCLEKPPATVGAPPSAEHGASPMPLLKGQKSGESNAAMAAVSRGKRFANSTPWARALHRVWQ